MTIIKIYDILEIEIMNGKSTGLNMKKMFFIIMVLIFCLNINRYVNAEPQVKEENNLEVKFEILLKQLRSKDRKIAEQAERNILKIGPEPYTIKKLEEMTVLNDIGANRARKIIQLYDNILSINFKIAKEYLDKNIKKNDSILIRISLKTKNLKIKKLAVQALGNINDKSSVPFLIECFEQNQYIRIGGSETQIEQQQLNEELIVVLKIMTYLNFNNKNLSSNSDIVKIINITKTWWEGNKDYVELIKNETKLEIIKK